MLGFQRVGVGSSRICIATALRGRSRPDASCISGSARTLDHFDGNRLGSRWVGGKSGKRKLKLPPPSASPSSLAASGSGAAPPQRAFPRKNYQPYKLAVNGILSSAKFKRRKESLIGQGLWTEGMFRSFQRWLLRAKPDHIIHTTPSESELTSRREALLSTLAASTATKGHLERDGSLVLGSCSRVLQLVFHELVDQCLAKGIDRNMHMLPVMWHKMKESGFVLQQPILRRLLDATMQSDIATNTTSNGCLLFEEMLSYHDCLYGGSEELYTKKVPAILRHLCGVGDADAAWKLLRKTPLPSSPQKEDRYSVVLAALAESGCFSKDGGVELFDEVATDLAARSCELSLESAIRLHNALAKGFESGRSRGGKAKDGYLPEWKDSADSNDPLVCRAEIDVTSMACLVTGTQLRCDSSLTLSEKKQLYEDVLDLGRSQSELSTELKSFANWLRERTGPPFTIFLDGGHIRRNIKHEMSNLGAHGHTALAILPEKVANDPTNKILPNDSGSVYVVPGGSDLSLFCMVSLVVDQSRSQSIHGPPPLRPKLMTHDNRLRDYRMFLRDPTLYNQWYGYNCKNWKDSGQGGDQQWDRFLPDQRENVYRQLIAIAEKKSTEANELMKFAGWMNDREGCPFTVILDGANVGRPHLDAMISSLEANGEYPLVVIPARNESWSQDTVSRLRDGGNIYIVPNGLDDDTFSMLATLVDQKKSHSKYSQNVRGVRPVLITDDRYRDHEEKIRDKALFSKWYRQHCWAHNELGLEKIPAMLIRRIECNEPTNGSKTWHFPINGSRSNERFVVRLPKSN